VEQPSPLNQAAAAITATLCNAIRISGMYTAARLCSLFPPMFSTDCTLQGIMPWAMRPTKSEHYTVKEAFSADSYIPGTIILIDVVVNTYEQK
jgi:hypothetical protein